MQATCAGSAIAVGGLLRDAISGLAMRGVLGEALAGPVTGYGMVYLVEIALLFATIVAIGPLVRPVGKSLQPKDVRLGLAGSRGA